MVQLLLLRPLELDAPALCVANTHLFFHPRCGVLQQGPPASV